MTKPLHIITRLLALGFLLAYTGGCDPTELPPPGSIPCNVLPVEGCNPDDPGPTPYACRCPDGSVVEGPCDPGPIQYRCPEAPITCPGGEVVPNPEYCPVA